MDMEKIIAAGLASYGLDSQKAPALARYGELLLEKNQVMNLTAIVEPVQVARLHMLDCAALCTLTDFAEKTLIDVGTGAGFPGLVLAILCPTLEVTLLDAQEKRLGFLEEVADELGLENVHTLHGRAEEVGKDPAFREKFHFATARAVADMAVLGELCLPLVEVGGQMLAMKTAESGQEVSGAESLLTALGGGTGSPWEYVIPGTDVRRAVWRVRKVSPTPPLYPRRWAKISKSKGKNS